ncbi:MAG: AAA family ATPase [Bacteroidia bacterium]
MNNKRKLDVTEALVNNISIVSNENLDHVDLNKREPSSMVQTIQSVIKYIVNGEFSKFGFTWHNDMIPVIDPSMQIDGSFFAFCKEYNYKVANTYTEAISVLAYADKDFDPFIMHGCFVVENEDFKFVKCSFTYKNSGSDNIASFIIIDKNNYQKYVKLKESFISWLREREGVVVKSLGGEDYLQDTNYKWNDLFFGDKESVKKDLKESIDLFLNSREYYEKNNIPWNMSILIECGENNGKTSIINTIISEYDLEPTTFNQYSVDDSVLQLLFKITENKYKSLVFIDDFDLFVDGSLNVEYFIDLLSKYENNDGNIILIACSKIPTKMKNYLYLFDKVIAIDDPDYDVCISNLFAKHLTQNSIKELKKVFKANSFSYGNIYKLYNLFIKQMINKDKNATTEIKLALEKISITEQAVKNKPKGLGLLVKK